MRITPLAPRDPYIVRLAGSFSTLMDSMSYGEIPDKLPFGPGVIGTPSTTYRGSLFPLNDDTPRTRTEMPPSDVRATVTPEMRPSRICSIGWPGTSATAFESTVDLSVVA